MPHTLATGILVTHVHTVSREIKSLKKISTCMVYNTHTLASSDWPSQDTLLVDSSDQLSSHVIQTSHQVQLNVIDVHVSYATSLATGGGGALKSLLVIVVVIFCLIPPNPFSFPVLSSVFPPLLLSHTFSYPRNYDRSLESRMR